MRNRRGCLNLCNGQWRAMVMIKGKMYQKASVNKETALFYLDLMQTDEGLNLLFKEREMYRKNKALLEEIKKERSKPRPPRPPRPRTANAKPLPYYIPVHDIHCQLTQKQIDEDLERHILEAQMIQRYRQSHDFTEINQYIEKKALPYINFYCTMYHMRQYIYDVVPSAVAVLYMRLSGGKAVYTITKQICSILKVYKKLNRFDHYDRIPENVFVAVEQINFEDLSNKYIVKRNH